MTYKCSTIKQDWEKSLEFLTYTLTEKLEENLSSSLNSYILVLISTNVFCYLHRPNFKKSNNHKKPDPVG